MKNLIHEIVTDLKFLYPCIAYDETVSEKDLLIKTETELSRIYPIKKTVKGMTSVGDDFWGQANFKDEQDNYYCEVDGSLYFKGKDMDADPSHQVNKVINYEFTDIDPEFTEFKPYMDKAKKYFENNSKVELINTSISLQKAENLRDSKIICLFKLKIK